MGAWIEIYNHVYSFVQLLSLLSWERGLKLLCIIGIIGCVVVAPLVGAWIEISIVKRRKINVVVAPLVGAWIEMIRAIYILLVI